MEQNWRIDFAIIGAQKSGTTSLAAQLAQHPQVNFCQYKEPHYFSCTRSWQSDLQKYHNLFNPSPGQVCGEASTSYTFLPEYYHTAQSLYEYNPDLKYIYIMRQPVERIVSAYNHGFIQGRIRNVPEVEIFQNPILINRSRYAVQIRHYLQLVPKDKILLLVFEEYIENQIKTLQRIAGFLEIDHTAFESIELEVLNQSVGATYPNSLGHFFKPFLRRIPTKLRNVLFYHKLDKKFQISNAFARILWQFLEDDVFAIEQLMGRRIEKWHVGFQKNHASK